MAATISAPGTNRATADTFVGQTIKDIRNSDWAESLNIPEGATVTVNRIVASDSHVIQHGDRVVFSRPTGEKG